MTIVTSDLREAARAIGPEIVAVRRAIHQEPELGYREVKTAARVAAHLRDLGLELRTGVAETGVIATVPGTRPGKTVLLRADMDALPIHEANATEYVSRTAGVMHACGHDAHTAILLGVARVLSERREQIRGTVRLMFQPAEEGGAGAMKMIDEGLLDESPVDAAFALHVDPERYVGQVGLLTGASHAASDRFEIAIQGRGGHAARPHRTVDPIVIAAQIVLALQTLVSRETSPVEPAVITVGSLTAGAAHNVIPDAALIKGTVRAYDEGVRTHIKQRLGEVARGIAGAMRATAEVDYRDGYPVMKNDAALVEVIGAAVRDSFGAEAVVRSEATMGGEDFAFVAQRVPAAMFRLGVRDRSWKKPRPLHTATFDLNEDAIPVGIAAMTATALRFLNGD